MVDAITIASEGTPSAAPGSGKSHYSDTNYQLLGAIIEAITGVSLAEAFQVRLFDRLALADTYLCSPNRLPISAPVYFKDARLSLPQALASERGAGGVVSTLADSLRFLRAYFDGELFDAGHFPRMKQWNVMFFPLQYGYGLMRFKLPRAMTLFRATPELIGHSGSSGSFAFHAPDEGLFIVGTFNQFDKPSRPFNFMLKVAATVS